MSTKEGCQATPHAELIARLMDSREPKTEWERAACREIERLRGLLQEAFELADNWPGIACADDLSERIQAALKPNAQDQGPSAPEEKPE